MLSELKLQPEEIPMYYHAMSAYEALLRNKPKKATDSLASDKDNSGN